MKVVDSIRRATNPTDQIVTVIAQICHIARIPYEAETMYEINDAVGAYAFDNAFLGGWLGTDERLYRAVKKMCRKRGLSRSQAQRFVDAMETVLGITMG